MIEQGVDILTLKAGTIVHVCGWPVEVKSDTDVQSHPGNIELIRRDLERARAGRSRPPADPDRSK
jgi:hypothetical protein